MLRRFVPLGIVAVIMLAAAIVIHTTIVETELSQILGNIAAVSPQQLALALAFTALSYLALTAYDALALRTIGRRLDIRNWLFASFAGYAISNTIGLQSITGGSVRYRIYSAKGLSTGEIGVVVALCSLTFWLGVAGLAGLALVLEGDAIVPAAAGIGAQTARLAGAAMLAGLALFLLWRTLKPGPVQIRSWTVPLPGLALSLGQLAAGMTDIAAAGAALWVLLPPEAGMGLVPFVGLYAAAIALGAVSHVPGGLGVFEAVILLAVPAAPVHTMMGALLTYRLIYYILPFGAAALMMGLREMRAARHALYAIQPLVRAIAPSVIATGVFIGGVVLLLSGATPAVDTRMEFLQDILPLQVIEGSHLLGSIAGLMLLVLAHGLSKRLDAAWHLAVLLVGAGIVFSLVKGLDWEEATFLSAILGALLMSHEAFYRKSSLLSESQSPLSAFIIACAVLFSIWIGFLAYRDVDYSQELWWQMTYEGDAPRFLRATLVVLVLAAAYGFWLLLRPAPPGAAVSEPPMESIAAIVARSDRAEANLAFTGDKLFLMSNDGDAFVMYQVQGASWIIMGDPVGNRAAFDELLWEFREMVDRHAGRMVVYQGGVEMLPTYLDLGMTLLKIGEEAIIPLAQFTLEGRQMANLRQSARKAEREGLVFEVVPATRVPPLLPEMKTVSDAWLREKAGSEKSFSVGFFSPAYLSRFEQAIVRKEGQLLAFANIWTAPNKQELSVDLMRHVPDAPRGLMDFLFVNLMLWGKAQGYDRFNLGMTPLAGLESHTLAPAWNKACNFLFRHGEQFYGFEGLRAYKAKFHPQWHPRYLACPGGLALPLILKDVTLLISTRRKPKPADDQLSGTPIEEHA